MDESVLYAFTAAFPLRRVKCIGQNKKMASGGNILFSSPSLARQEEEEETDRDMRRCGSFQKVSGQQDLLSAEKLGPEKY